jgi:hypothetical protein
MVQTIGTVIKWSDREILGHHEDNKKAASVMKRLLRFFGAPKEIRTPSLLIRSQMLYPVELWVRIIEKAGYSIYTALRSLFT